MLKKFLLFFYRRVWGVGILVRKFVELAALIERKLKPNQREYILKKLSPRQKGLIKRVLSRHTQGHLEKIKHRLYSLGFIEKSIEEMQILYKETKDPIVKRMVAWELSVWHANQYNKKGARQCLELLHQGLRKEKKPLHIRQTAIIKAECYKILGKEDEGRKVISEALTKARHAELFLAATNFEPTFEGRLRKINRALEYFGLPVYNCANQLHTFMREKSNVGDTNPQYFPVKVSVIMPVYNGKNVIQTALDSVLSQTWRNLEVLVVNTLDKSNVTRMLQDYAQQDERIRLIQSDIDGGYYVARNLGLKIASGDFVTVNDEDEWSHPEKIRKQVQHLMNNPKAMGNTTQKIWVDADLEVYRRKITNSSFYTMRNLTSLMFRREPVVNEVGYWDSVSFGADDEFIIRIKKIFGKKALTDLQTGPLTFQVKQFEDITEEEIYGGGQYLSGASKEYHESYSYFHANSDNMRYDFPQESRPFPVPELIFHGKAANNKKRHFDVILASDFRLIGGSTISNFEEIKAQKIMGLKTGLIQLARYDIDPTRAINPMIREMIDGNQVQMIVYGERVSCDVLIVRYPPVLHERQQFVPEVDAKDIRIIINQPPMSDYGPDAVLRYDIKKCQKHILDYFGKSATWHPIGPLVREALHKYHSEDLTAIRLSSEDWSNIIDLNGWRRHSRPKRGSKIRIGRHSRDHEVKWPADAKEILSIYPDSSDYEIFILGGGTTPFNILKYKPRNWHVYEFDEIHPKDFLSRLDVFVYFTHPNWVESFGRVIIEAMAVGVPVILPHNYKKLFGDAAIYAEPLEVETKIKRLMSDVDYYEAQVEKAQLYVEQQFGYSRHAYRLRELLSKPIQRPE